MTDVQEVAKRKPGRPSNAERAARAASQREQVSVGRQNYSSVKNGKAVAIGRDGQELTRTRTVTSDIFHIPENEIPSGWSYQWNSIEVLGKPFSAMELAAAQSMMENGWRPVPAGRHPSRFMLPGMDPNSPIVRDGLRLEERPAILDVEAREEEKAKAIKQVRDQHEQLRMTAKLPSGFSDDPKYRGTGAVARQTYEPSPADARPRLEIDPG